MSFKSGFVTIIGRPNVGKSTLLNNILGQKVAIMSDKPQTTRHAIRAIYNDDESQIVFIDTPGMHKPKNKLGTYMVKQASETISDVDLVIFMVDHSQTLGAGDRNLIEILSTVNTKVVLAINKTDKISPEEFKGIYDGYSKYDFIDEIVGLSAVKNKGVTDLIKVIKNIIPEGPQFYPADMITDQTERMIAAETIREKMLMYLDEEVPHGVAVEVVTMKKRKNKELYDIEANIVCEKKSHKGIIIGKEGRKLKGIGKSAREDIEGMLDCKVNLQIWVKIREGWRDNANYMKDYGYKDK